MIEAADLYDPNPVNRRRAAAPYRPTPKSPSYWGEPWPASLAADVERWPLHMIGSANAWLVFVAPNPGPKHPNRAVQIEPFEPTLGREPHPHVADDGYQYGGWTRIRNMVAGALSRMLSRKDALASFMLVNLSETHSARSVWGEDYGEWGLPRISRALALAHPRLVVAQNEEIYFLIKRNAEPLGPTDEMQSTHMRGYVREFGPVRDRSSGASFVLARAEAHFGQGSSSWSETTYLPHLAEVARQLEE